MFAAAHMASNLSVPDCDLKVIQTWIIIERRTFHENKIVSHNVMFGNSFALHT